MDTYKGNATLGLKRDMWLQMQLTSIRDSNLFFLKIYGSKL